jgi:hypothetical protein
MEEIVKLIAEAEFMKAIHLILSIPEDDTARSLWKLLAEASSDRRDFQVGEYAWTRAAGKRIRMNLILKP